MRDAEQPASELLIVAQVSDIADRVDERLLHEIRARLFVADQFKNVNIKRKLVAAEKRVPGPGVSGPGLRYGQLFNLSHAQHLQTVECRR